MSVFARRLGTRPRGGPKSAAQSAVSSSSVLHSSIAISSSISNAPVVAAPLHTADTQAGSLQTEIPAPRPSAFPVPIPVLSSPPFSTTEVFSAVVIIFGNTSGVASTSSSAVSSSPSVSHSSEVVTSGRPAGTSSGAVSTPTQIQRPQSSHDQLSSSSSVLPLPVGLSSSLSIASTVAPSRTTDGTSGTVIPSSASIHPSITSGAPVARPTVAPVSSGATSNDPSINRRDVIGAAIGALLGFVLVFFLAWVFLKRYRVRSNGRIIKSRISGPFLISKGRQTTRGAASPVARRSRRMTDTRRVTFVGVPDSPPPSPGGLAHHSHYDTDTWISPPPSASLLPSAVGVAASSVRERLLPEIRPLSIPGKSATAIPSLAPRRLSPVLPMPSITAPDKANITPTALEPSGSASLPWIYRKRGSTGEVPT